MRLRRIAFQKFKLLTQPLTNTINLSGIYILLYFNRPTRFVFISVSFAAEKHKNRQKKTLR